MSLREVPSYLIDADDGPYLDCIHHELKHAVSKKVINTLLDYEGRYICFKLTTDNRESQINKDNTVINYRLVMFAPKEETVVIKDTRFEAVFYNDTSLRILLKQIVKILRYIL